jgi:uncharacterized protein (TIGR03067 family)
MKTVALFSLVIGIAIPAFVFAQNDKDDKALIQGSWKVESSKDEGQDNPSTKGIVVTFKDGTVSAKIGEEVHMGTYALDPSKTPKWIDIGIGDGGFLGIYELKGDMLRICHGKSGGERSTQFVSEPDSPNQVLLLLKREKQ